MRSLAHGFTIIEIIVVIALLAIFTLTATSVDFSRLSVRQEQEIFTNQVIGTIQSLKNFAFQ
jgi:prepilin-type N-terminal cleavage/methylation domain-containing protein